MLRIEKVYVALVGAAADRRVVTKGAKGKLNKEDELFYKNLCKETGNSTRNPVKVVKSFRRAYNINMERMNTIEQLNAPFRKPSLLTRIVKALLK